MRRYVLTQFNSHTLNTHINSAYPPAVFGGAGRQGFVDVLAAHQTPDSDTWHRGSADAVRRNLPAILEQYRGVGLPDELVVLSGEAIYRMVRMQPPMHSLLLRSDQLRCTAAHSRVRLAAHPGVTLLPGYDLEQHCQCSALLAMVLHAWDRHGGACDLSHQHGCFRLQRGPCACRTMPSWSRRTGSWMPM